MIVEMTPEPAAEGDTSPKAPAGHFFKDFHGKRMLIKDISVGQRMVAQGIANQLQAGAGPGSVKLMDKIWVLIGALIPLPEDRDHVETLILQGAIDFEELAPVFFAGAPAAPTTGPAKKPRRGK